MELEYWEERKNKGKTRIQNKRKSHSTHGRMREDQKAIDKSLKFTPAMRRQLLDSLGT